MKSMHSQTLGRELAVPKYAFLIFDAKVLVETAPTPPPPPRHTLFTQRRKVTVSDPANSFVVMLKCRFNRHHTNRTVTGR